MTKMSGLVCFLQSVICLLEMLNAKELFTSEEKPDAGRLLLILLPLRRDLVIPGCLQI